MDDSLRRPPRPGQRDLRRIAAVSYERTPGHRAGAAAQGPARRLGRAARLPRHVAVRELLEDRGAPPDRRDVRGPHRLLGACAGARRRRHLEPEAADRRRRTPVARRGECVRDSDRRGAVRGLWAHGGHMRERARLADRATLRHGRAAPALPGGQPRSTSTRVTGEWTFLPEGEVGTLVLRGPNVFAGYLAEGESGLELRPRRQAPSRLARHRRSRLHRGGRVHSPCWPREGSDHPRGSQHRSRDDRRCAVWRIPRSPPPLRWGGPTRTPARYRSHSSRSRGKAS